MEGEMLQKSKNSFARVPILHPKLGNWGSPEAQADFSPLSGENGPVRIRCMHPFLCSTIGGCLSHCVQSEPLTKCHITASGPPR